MCSVDAYHNRTNPSLETNGAKSAFSSLCSYHTSMFFSHDNEEIYQLHLLLFLSSMSINFAGVVSELDEENSN